MKQKAKVKAGLPYYRMQQGWLHRLKRPTGEGNVSYIPNTVISLPASADSLVNFPDTVSNDTRFYLQLFYILCQDCWSNLSSVPGLASGVTWLNLAVQKHVDIDSINKCPNLHTWCKNLLPSIIWSTAISIYGSNPRLWQRPL